MAAEMDADRGAGKDTAPQQQVAGIVIARLQPAGCLLPNPVEDRVDDAEVGGVISASG